MKIDRSRRSLRALAAVAVASVALVALLVYGVVGAGGRHEGQVPGHEEPAYGATGDGCGALRTTLAP